MHAAELTARAEAIAANRTAGASELAGQLLPLLEAAIGEGREATVMVARIICHGQPAMAPLWNLCAVALAEFRASGRFTRISSEVRRAPRALERVAVAALGDALLGVRQPQLLTLSYSGSVRRALQALASHRAFQVVCAESLPAREGARLRDELAAAGVRAELVLDAELTAYLPTAHAVVVGADAISGCDWINKSGTFGVAAAAWFRGVPVFVIASRDKVEADVLRQRVELPRLFERTPSTLATLFLTDRGVVPPDGLPSITETFAAELTALIAVLS